MAVPKKRRSKSRSRIKKAAWGLETPNFIACPNCATLTHSHRACMACGFYKGKQVVQIKVKEPKESTS